MGQTGDKTSQYWKFTPANQGYYRVTNSATGDGKSLDTAPNGNNDPLMGQTGDYSGQYWKLTPTTSGYYRLTNSFLGNGRSLDTYSGNTNTPFMGQTGNASGQSWKLTKVVLPATTNKPAATTTTNPPATTTTTNPTTTTSNPPATTTTTNPTTTTSNPSATTTTTNPTTTTSNPPAATTSKPATTATTTNRPATTSTPSNTTTAATTANLQPYFTNFSDGDYFNPNTFKLEGETLPNANVSIKVSYTPQSREERGALSRIGDAVITVLGGSRTSSNQQETEVYATTVKADASGRFQITMPTSISQSSGTRFTIRATAVQGRNNRSQATVLNLVQQ